MMSCEEIAEEDDQSDGINLSRALEQRLRAAELMEIEVILVKKGVRTLSTSARLNLKERSDLLATTRQLWRILHMLPIEGLEEFFKSLWTHVGARQNSRLVITPGQPITHGPVDSSSSSADRQLPVVPRQVFNPAIPRPDLSLPVVCADDGCPALKEMPGALESIRADIGQLQYDKSNPAH
jgi:hypothetical protein